MCSCSSSHLQGSVTVRPFHPSVSPSVGDLADDALSSRGVGPGVAGRLNPAECPKVGAASAFPFVCERGRVAEHEFDGFLVGDVVQRVDLEQPVHGCEALGFGRCLLAGCRIVRSECQRQLNHVVH